jgi:hypothetical protein
MTRLGEIVFNWRRFIVDVTMGFAALLLAVAAFTATTDPYLLGVLAALIGVALMLEPRRPWPQTPSQR